ncbi:NADH-quinone oxidoreductase subunit B family protein [Desulfurococcaceae archaeon MEX13E-LK6-19]|nr:NADH-quinone oxidoreductase subunit B family protein [Desulfurococcaceae archaeon MEX13E-LK6-19]
MSKLKSIWVFHLNTGACNGCDIEVLDIFTPYYDVERLGVKLVGSPRHAHALLVTGPLTRQCVYAAKRAYEAMPPSPRIVIAVGTCACSGGIFYDSYSIYRVSPRDTLEYPRRGGIEEILPVDIYIPGCPPRPEEILYGLALLKGIVEKRVKQEYQREEEESITLPENITIEERIKLDLRCSLRKIVGYFDRDAILEDFMKLVEKAKDTDNEEAVLHNLVEEYCRKVSDSRIRFCIRFLEKEYWRVRRRYEEMVPSKINIA